MSSFIIFILLILIVFYFTKYIRIHKKYSPILDIEQEAKKLDKSIDKLRKDYSEKKNYYDSLVSKISLYEDKQEIYEYGLYEPVFDFRTSEEYKQKILLVRESEKKLIKDKQAAICTTVWAVNGRKSEGTKQTNRYIKLMLRAFNGECDTLIAEIRWNNANKMIERLTKSFEDINKLGESHTTFITSAYKDLKMLELQLAFEYQEKLHDEKEEQKALREQIREEEKLQKEIERKQKEIEDQQKQEMELQKKLSQAIEKGKEDAAKEYKEQIDQLNKIIKENQRTVSQAQLTKTGYIYIISNIGSFGKDVYKIGMTRRLNPQERIDELGSASVPFEFDVHAFIKTENAPELENKFHKNFSNKRVNLVNQRKEFFNVTLDEIERFAKLNNIDVEFTKLAQAKEYNETLMLKNKKIEISEENIFPDEI